MSLRGQVVSVVSFRRDYEGETEGKKEGPRGSGERSPSSFAAAGSPVSSLAGETSLRLRTTNAIAPRPAPTNPDAAPTPPLHPLSSPSLPCLALLPLLSSQPPPSPFNRAILATLHFHRLCPSRGGAGSWKWETAACLILPGYERYLGEGKEEAEGGGKVELS